MKKTLIVLLAILALVCLMIVPASAEETHTGHCVCGGTYAECEHADIEGEWIAWDGTTNITASGNYYLTKAVTTQRWLGAYDYAGEERLVINLCLNGISCDSAYRVFGVGKNTTVNLMNCSETTAVLKGNCSTQDNGKVIRIHHASSILNMYGNIRLEGKNATDRVTIAGGAVISEGIFNMYGGEVVGAYVGGLNKEGTGVHNGNGGAIYLGGAGVWNMYGGTVIGGEGGRFGSNAVNNGVAQTRSLGGVVYLTNGAKWNMYGGEVFGGKVGDAAVAYITGANARMNVYGGTIHAGDAAFGGGVSKVSGSSIVTVSGGLIVGNNSYWPSNQNAGGAGGGAFMVDGGHLVVNGTAEIRDCTTTNFGGAIKVINANSTITLGGSAKVHSNGTSNGASSNNASGKNRNNNIYIYTGMKALIIEDTLTSDAYFGIDMATPGVFTNAITAEQAKCFYGDNAIVSQLEDGTLTLSEAGHVSHCACGGSSKFCDEHEDVEWVAYTSGNITASGNYYLAQDHYGSQIQIGTTNAAPITVNICLNGNDFTNPSFRAFIVWNNATVTFCNCKGESGGRIQAGGPAEGVSDHTGLMMQHGTVNIYEGVSIMRTSERKVTGSGGIQLYSGATLNLYGGTIKGGPGNGDAGTINVNSGATFNMYDGLVYGGTAINSHGGNIYVRGGGVANFYGGIVRDGVAVHKEGATGDALDKNGGNLAMLEGSKVLITGDAQFIGGTANRAGNIFVHKGTLTISGNAKVLGGTATNLMYGPGAHGIHLNTGNRNGAVIELAGTPEITDLRLQGGAYIVNKGMEAGIIIENLHTNTADHVTDTYLAEDVFAGITYNNPYNPDEDRTLYNTRDGVMAAPKTNAHVHCLCGSTTDEHLEGCDGLPVYYWAWDGKSSKTSGSYGFYLTGDASDYQDWLGASSTGCFTTKVDGKDVYSWGVDRDGDGVAESGFEISICMNGHNRTSGGRSFGIGSGSIVNFTNCSSNGGNIIAGGENNAQGGNIFLHGKDHIVRALGNVTFGMNPGKTITSGGVFYLPAGSKLIINGATINGATVTGAGGAIYATGAEIVLHDGLISGGTAGWGGNVAIDSNATFTMYGGIIENGTATNKNDHGGNLYVYRDCQATILGGIIRNGKTTGTGDANGGNIAMSDTNNNGDLSTLTIGGNAQILDGKAYRGANVFFHSGILTIEGNAVINAGTVNEEGSNPDTTVKGYMNPGVVLNNTVGNNTNPEGILIIKGTPKVADLYLNGPVMDISGLEVGAEIGLDCSFAGMVTNTAITDEVAAGFSYVGAETKEIYNTVYGLLLITPGNEVTVGGKTMPIEAAVLVCSETGDYIKLDKDLNGDIGIAATVTIDLNGHDIRGDIKIDENSQLNVFDSTNTSLVTASEGYGKIYGTIMGGPLMRVMTTPESFGHNYRYVYVREQDGGMSFHRIYMSVKSIVMTPADAGVNFKTVLKCNDVVARYLAIDGYGVVINGNYYYYSNTTVAAGSANEKLVKVYNVLGTNDMNNLEKAQAKAETVVEAKVFFKLTDGAYAYSSANGMSFLDLVTYSNANFEAMTERQKLALGAMYEKFEPLMKTWDDATVGNIRGFYSDIPADEDAIYHCYCYGTEAADVASACAEAGHPQVKWTAWNRYNSLPTYAGNYYLTGDVSVDGVAIIQANAQVAIDLNGYSITSTFWDDEEDTKDRNNIFLLSQGNSALIITDSVGGGTIIPSSNTSWETGFGLVAYITNGSSTFSMYAGTIDASGVVGDYGVVFSNNGTLNIYGGTILAGISGNGSGGAAIYTAGTFNMYSGLISGGQQLDPLTEQRTTRGGGNIRVGGGTVNMYGGVIENGYAVGQGGNIRVGGSAVFNMYGGSIVGGLSDNYGGNVFVTETAKFNLIGGTVEGGNALRGGNFLMGGTTELNISGGSILGGYVSQTGGSIRAEGNSKVTMTGGKIIGMTAEELAEIPVEEGAKPISNTAINGGLIFMETNSVLTVSGKSTITGGIASTYGGTIFLNGASKLEFNGGTINGGSALYGGAIAMDMKASVNMTAGTLNGGVANPANTNSKGGVVYMIATDKYNEEGVKTADYGTTFTMTGGTIYGGEAYNGAAFYIREDATVSISAGTVYAGVAARGGGAFKAEAGAVINLSGTAVVDGANPYLEEGTVHSGNNGGGIFVDSATLNMSGDAIIQNCIAAKKGGGIMINNDAKKALGCTVNLTGNAQIVGNSTASTVTNLGGGVILNTADCKLNVSGNVVISGNYDAYGMASDVALPAGAALTVVGNLGSDASIGIYNTDAVFANGNYANSNNAVYFYSNIVPDEMAVAENNTLKFAPSFLVGYSVAEISPTDDGTVYGTLIENIWLTGYGNESERIATGVDEELGLQASVLCITGIDGETILVISVDGGSFSNYLRIKTTDAIVAKTGIPADHIMFNANHQHSSPVDNNTEYRNVVINNISDAAVNAMASRAKTTMYAGRTNVNAGYTYSQHFNYVRNCTLQSKTGEIVGMVTDNHSDYGRVTYSAYIVESMADDEVQLVKFVREGASTVIMANFQTHPHLLTGSSSTIATSDIVGVFRNELKKSLEANDASGTEYDIMYISGAGGNINPNGRQDSRSTDSSDTTKAWAKSSNYATNMAHAKLLPSRTYSAMTKSGFWTAMASGDVNTANQVVGYQKMINSALSWTGKTTAQVVAAAKEIQEKGYADSYRDNFGIYSKFHANAIVTRENNKEGDLYNIYLGAFSVGDLAFVSAPYEMFDTNGMEIKDGSPFKMTFVNSLSTLGSNKDYTGHIGYIPSALGYANGGYSTDIAYVAAGTGELLVADFLEMLENLK